MTRENAPKGGDQQPVTHVPVMSIKDHVQNLRDRHTPGSDHSVLFEDRLRRAQDTKRLLGLGF